MKLLLTVAHPDDEAFGCGSVLAHATARGIESTVVCATRGELGDVAPACCGPEAAAWPPLAPSPDELGAIREGELRAATGRLGVGRVEVLGWRDSGMDGPPPPGSLAAAAVDEVAARVAAIIDDVRPDVVVTLDASDGHRDHAAIRDATIAAAQGCAGRRPRLYLWCLPASLMLRFTGQAHLGTPDESITTVVDVERHLDVRWAAMRAHRSQVPPYEAMAPDLQHAFLATDRLVRIDPPWTGGEIERDWVPR